MLVYISIVFIMWNVNDIYIYDCSFCVLQRFAAVIMRIRDPKTTALIFASGKMVRLSVFNAILFKNCHLNIKSLKLVLGFTQIRPPVLECFYCEEDKGVFGNWLLELLNLRCQFCFVTTGKHFSGRLKLLVNFAYFIIWGWNE